MRTADKPDYATILGIVRDWPAGQRFLLVQEVLQTLAPSEPPRPAARNTLERARGLLATGHSPPSDDEVAQWLDERRIRRYGQ